MRKEVQDFKQGKKKGWIGIKNSKKEILKLHSEIGESLRTSVTKAIRIGELLKSVKENLRHGQWENWVADSLGNVMSQRSAERYMALARLASKSIKNAKLSDLTLFDAYKCLPHRLRGDPPYTDNSVCIAQNKQEWEEALDYIQSWPSAMGTIGPFVEAEDETKPVEDETKQEEETYCSSFAIIGIGRNLYERIAKLMDRINYVNNVRQKKPISIKQFINQALRKECSRVESKFESSPYQEYWIPRLMAMKEEHPDWDKQQIKDKIEGQKHIPSYYWLWKEFSEAKKLDENLIWEEWIKHRLEGINDDEWETLKEQERFWR